MSLARLVLNKSALTGLRVLLWDEDAYQESLIQLYDEDNDCFIVFHEQSNSLHAVQFHLFTVEEEQNQLVLKVTHCTHVELPVKYNGEISSAAAGRSTDATGGKPALRLLSDGDERYSDASSLQASRQISAQPSAELSQQLSVLVGQSFSHTEEGFQPVLPENAADAPEAAAADMLASDSEVETEDGSYWGSPVKHDRLGLAAAAAAIDVNRYGGPAEAAAAPTADAVTDMPVSAPEPDISLAGLLHAPAAPAVAQTFGAVGSRRSNLSSYSSWSQPDNARQDVDAAGAGAFGAAAAAPAPCDAAAASPAASFSSFKEISRIISGGDSPVHSIPIGIRKGSRSSHPAARLLAEEETGTWGTPTEGSPRGTSKDLMLQHQLTAASEASALAGQNDAGAHGLGQPDNDALMEGQQEEQHNRQDSPSQQGISGFDGVNEANETAAGLPWLPGGDDGEEDVAPRTKSSTGLMPATTPRQPVAGLTLAIGADAAGEVTAEQVDDFRIPAAIDVRLPARAIRASNRELYRIPSSEATDGGMMVDIPQPLSTRRASRTSGWNLPPSDPGFAAGTAATSSGGGGIAGELRRSMSSHISNPSSRRVSRSMSSRVTADQDWAPGIDWQLQAQQLQNHSAGGASGWPGQGYGPGFGAGMPLHVPGSTSRRTSRTVSGRLALDQVGLPTLATVDDDAEPDVPVRPATATSMAADTVVSARRQSTSNRPDTPDSDGFGYSEFEGIEPLVPPEVAQWDAIAEEAVVHAADTIATTPTTHRHQRRSARNIGAHATGPPAMSRRASMRLSDQDDHALPLPPVLTAVTVAAAAATPRIAAAAGSNAGAIAARQLQHLVNGSIGGAEVGSSGGADQQFIEPPPQLSLPPLAARAQRRSDEGSNLAAKMFHDNSTVHEALTAAPGGNESAGKTPAGMSTALGLKGSGKSLPGILQPVAAAAEVAAAAIGYALGGKGTAGEQLWFQQQAAAAAATGNAAREQQPTQQTFFCNEQALAPGANAADSQQQLQTPLSKQLTQNCVGPTDSFNCPLFIPFSDRDSSNKLRMIPFADSNQFGCDSGPFTHDSSCNTLPAFQIGTAVADRPEALQHSVGSFTTPSGLSAGALALLRKHQVLPPAALADGSEWGSGAILGPQLTSGIDTPTGSAVFKSTPAGSTDSGSVPPGELSAALEALSAVGGTTASHRPSRFGREPAGTVLFAGMAGGSGSFQVVSGFGINEITPADENHIVNSGDDKSSSQRGLNQAAKGKSWLGLGDAASGRDTSGTAAGAGSRNHAGPQLGFSEGAAAGGDCHDNDGISSTFQLKSDEPEAAYRAARAAASQPASRNCGCSADSSAGGNGWPAPPSYAESAGADADDERSPLAGPLAASGERVWPAEYASASGLAPTAARNGSSSSDGSKDGSRRESVRHEAELAQIQGAATAVGGTVTSAVANSAIRPDSQQVNGGAGKAGEGPAPGLVRRAVSRSPSQPLPAGVAAAADGIVLLPSPAFAYADDDKQPLVRQERVVAYSAGQVPYMLEEARAQIGRVVLHTILAISTQWFDSMAFVVLGSQLVDTMGPPSLSQQQRLGLLFAVFAAGHVFWLFGALLWPWVAGRAGRKTALVWTVGLSAFPTVLLGCMPTYSEGGLAGIVIIATLRILVGTSLGNDAPAAAVYLTEHAPQFPCLHASLVPCAMATGALGAGLVALFFSWVLSATSLGVFGWRLTLLASLVVNAVGAVLRGFVLQDPERGMTAAEVADWRNGHVGRVLRCYLLQVLLALPMLAFAASGLYVLTAWMPIYFTQLTALPTHLAMTIHTVNTAVLAGSTVLGGFLADKYGRTPLLLSTLAAAALTSYPIWLVFSLSMAGVSWFGQFVLAVTVGLHWGGLPGLVMDMFPKEVRSSAMTLCLLLPMVLLGVTAPLLALGLVVQTQAVASPAILMIVMAVTSGVAITAQEFRGQGRS
eukprot:GHRR01001455.1.p1 GENE.GHRR01001455.1~~GHRR01001455.1.p1  ORF type:complete len:1942 (+),score=725.52 GHRR01001455.1:344-6169(+)